MIKAVIFDLDGLLVDTEILHSQAYEAILKEYKKKPKLNDYGIVQISGLIARKNWQYLKKKHNLKEDVEILLEKKRHVFLKIIKNIKKPKEGVKNLLNLLKEEKVKMALASSSTKEYILTILSNLELIEYFEVIVSFEEVQKPKPAPDIYLEAAKRLKIEPSSCVVLEDSESGINSGKNAGMKVIAVPTKFTKNQNLSQADLIVNSLKDIKWSTISNI